MVTKKRFKLSAIFSALLLALLLVCSQAVTVFAQEPTYEEYVAENGQTVIQADILPQGVESLTDLIVSVREEDKLAVATKVVEVATEKLAFSELYSNDYLTKNFDPRDSLATATEIRDNAVEACNIKDGKNLVNSTWNEFLNGLIAGIQQADEDLKAIFSADLADYQAYVAEALDQVKAVYDARLEQTQSDYQAELESTFKEHVATEDSTGEMSFVKGIEYEGQFAKRCEGEVTDLKNHVIKILNAVPRNVMEYAYRDYHDWLAIINGDVSATPEEEAQAVDKLKESANKAVKWYDRASAEEQLEFSGVYQNLKDFLDNIDVDPDWKPIRTSSITDAKRVITITAKYANGEKAEVFPENCTLNVYKTLNGASKRNATTQIKELDKKLSIAYFISLRIVRGTFDFKLPERDDNNRLVTYEIKVDLAKYCSAYLESEVEAKKIEKIKQAVEYLSALESENKPLICYGYKSGAIDSLSNVSLEGDILVFTTNSHLSNFCLAGINLDSLLTNPLFWVIVVAALILVIIIIKIIVKHVRYTIKFNSNGGSEVRSIRAAKNEYFILPADPVKAGYVFSGWYVDKDLKTKFIGNQMLKRKGFKLHAKWTSPVTTARLMAFYDEIRNIMCSYKKESYKELVGLTENEYLAFMSLRDNHLQLNLALNPDSLKSEGFSVTASKEKRYAEIPAQITISTEELFEQALKLVNRVLLAKGLQKAEDFEPAPAPSEEERRKGFAFIVHNDRVASTAEDYFELLRVAVKSYCIEEESDKFKPGDKITLARIYITNEVACLHLPTVKGEKGLKPSRDAQFSDTPVVFKILAPRDMLEAYALIEKVMYANGFVKNPENANNLSDVKVPATNGFAYTLVF